MLGWFDIDGQLDALEVFRRRMDQLFEEASREPGVAPQRCGGWPRANLSDRGEELVLEAGLPGVRLEDVRISGNADTLSISGQRPAPVPEGYRPLRQERANIHFCRSFSLPVKVELDKADAALKDGILTVRLPKAPELKPRAVAVRAG